jgi:putative ABC transport system substrate-binding protein
MLSAFRKGLSQAGFDEGRNASIEFRFAEGNVSRLPTLAAELVSSKVAIIVTGTTAASLAAKMATSRYPSFDRR